MTWIEFAGTRIEANEEGFVVNPDEWTRELAEYLAQKDGLTLTERHWEIIDFLRRYFTRYQIAPMMKILAREVARMRGPEEGTILYLHQLFPGGPARQACRYAGLPKATGCI